MNSLPKRSKKAGLPPGTLVHVGEQRRAEATITIINYTEGQIQERKAHTIDECLAFRDSPTVTWINVEGIHDIAILEKLGQCFALHPLSMEDILNTEQRPKLEDFRDYLYVVLKMFSPRNHGTIVTEQVSLILGKNFVISFQEGLEGDVFDPIRQRLRKDSGRIRRMGADYLFYALLDTIIDSYFFILERLGDQIGLLEDEVMVQPAPATVQKIHYLKRELLFLRKAIWPLREVLSGLQRGESALVASSTLIYLKDVYDHTIQMIDTIEILRDMITGMLDIYLSSVSNRLNEVMKVLTIITTIFMPLSFIAGIYGMNFEFMPELKSPWGYPAVLTIMLGIALVMVMFVKRKKWL